MKKYLQPDKKIAFRRVDKKGSDCLGEALCTSNSSFFVYNPITGSIHPFDGVIPGLEFLHSGCDLSHNLLFLITWPFAIHCTNQQCSPDGYQDCYSYNSIKRTCSIKRPGLEFFKKTLLNVPYHRKSACNKQLNVLLY